MLTVVLSGAIMGDFFFLLLLYFSRKVLQARKPLKSEKKILSKFFFFYKASFLTLFTLLPLEVHHPESRLLGTRACVKQAPCCAQPGAALSSAA